MYFKNHRNISGISYAPCKNHTRDLSTAICQTQQALGLSFLNRYSDQYLSNTLSVKPNDHHDYHMLKSQIKPPNLKYNEFSKFQLRTTTRTTPMNTFHTILHTCSQSAMISSD
jgi:hypothetical protein